MSCTQTVGLGAGREDDDAGASLPVLDEDSASPALIFSTSLFRCSRSSSSSFFKRALFPGLRSLEYLPSVLVILESSSLSWSYSGPSPSNVGEGLKKLTNFCHMDFSSAEVEAAVAKTISGMDMARDLFMGEMIEKSLYNTICFYYI